QYFSRCLSRLFSDAATTHYPAIGLENQNATIWLTQTNRPTLSNQGSNLAPQRRHDPDSWFLLHECQLLT
ncbi:MAG TPA: hypothetical protein VK657_01710, partial [Terriglobales bacterium]|nr:hypothetical protein [Terriglobales bacterium]